MIEREDKKTKLISFTGKERGDVPFYMAALLACTGNEVLIVDNSEGSDLFGSVPKPDGEDFAKTGRVSVVRKKKYSEEFFSVFDYVIIYNGYCMGEDFEELVNESDVNYLVTDYSWVTTLFMKKQLENLSDKKFRVIFIDKPSGKIHEKLILDEIGVANVEEQYMLPADPQDYGCYVNFLRNGRQKLAPLSADFKNMFTQEFSILTESEDVKFRKKTLKKAYAGKLE